jgi:hypothetical protein
MDCGICHLGGNQIAAAFERCAERLIEKRKRLLYSRRLNAPQRMRRGEPELPGRIAKCEIGVALPVCGRGVWRVRP